MGFQLIMQKVLGSTMLSNSLALLLVRGTTILTRIAALSIIAKFTSAAEFGTVTFAIAIAEIGKVVADFGVDTLALREFAIAEDPRQQRNFSKTVAWAKLVCSLAVYFPLALYFLLTEPLTNALIGVLGGLLIITTLASNFSINYFQARLRVNEILLPILANNFLAITLVALSLSLYPQAWLGVAILPAAEAVNAWVLQRYLVKQVDFSKGQVERADVLFLLRRSLPIAISGIVVALYIRLDVIVLKLFLDAETVGQYGMAFRLTEPFQLVTSAFALSAYSHLSSILAAQKFSVVKKFILKYIAGILVYGLSICAVLWLLAPPMISMVYADKYQAAIPILRVLASAIIFRALTASFTCMIQAYGHYRWLTYISFGNLAVIAVFLSIFVPRLGAIGAAYALLSGEVLNLAVQGTLLWYVSKNRWVA